MKLISINSITIGEQLSFDLRGSNGNMLLRSKTVLTKNMVARLKMLGIYVVYVDDDMYDDVTVRQAIPDDMKTRILGELETARPKLLRGGKIDDQLFKTMGRDILDEVRVSILEPINMVNTYAVDNPLLLHSINTAIITAALSLKAGVRPQFAENYVVAALLHDLCLEDISKDYDDNFEHAAKIYNQMKATSVIDATCFMAAALHHERYDGTGGPRKLSGKQINEGARIIAVADLFDQVSFGYAGKPLLEAAQTIEYITAQAGLGLDPDLTKIFSSCISIYPTGATVILNQKLKAVVLKQNAGMPARPIVRILSPDPSERVEINMLSNPAIFIDSIEL